MNALSPFEGVGIAGKAKVKAGKAISKMKDAMDKRIEKALIKKYGKRQWYLKKGAERNALVKKAKAKLKAGSLVGGGMAAGMGMSKMMGNDGDE